MNACTIVARNYLAHARVLAESFLEHHPSGEFTVLVLDAAEGVAAEPNELFTTISPYEIGIERAEFHRMAMIYDVMELATAVKPWLLRTLLDDGASDVTYFDPDIQIFAALDDISALAREHSIVLIPHVTAPMPRDRRVPDETTILYSGVYNLGFIAVGDRARAFLDWWSERLARECVLAPGEHRFVDQRWIDFVPGMYDHYILRDPGCDVAHWNLWGRTLARSGERYTVDGAPLRFYHFSGFDPDQPVVLSKHQGSAPRIILKDNPALERLCAQYAERLLAHGYREAAAQRYGFGTLLNGIPISPELRQTYRAVLLAAEDQGTPLPPEPFDPAAADEFAHWLHLRGLGAASNGRGRRALVAGVNVAGYLRAELGIGEAARQVVTALERAGVPFAAITYSEATHSRQDHPQLDAPREPVYDTNLICVNADGMSRFAASVGQEFFAGRYTIGFWWWEVSVFPPSMYSGFEFVDEIWVGSEHTRAAIAAQTPKNVVKVPMPVDVPTHLHLSRRALGLPEEFLFLFTFDFFSVLERKNPLGVVEAFKRAFAPREGPKLVLKSINGDMCTADLRRLQHAAAAHPDIVVIDAYVTPREKDAMAASCDCYVSLHRSEGFGLTLAEAMVYEKPVIATGYSGNLEFMDEDNSYLVPYDLTTVPGGCEPYPVGAEWAEPDLDAAAALMRHVFEHQDEAAARGRRAREAVLSRQNPARAGAFMRTRLDEIRRDPPKVLAADLLQGLPSGAASKSPLRRASAALVQVPTALARAEPRTRPLARIGRRGLLKALWPYIRQQQELSGAVVEAVGATDAALQRYAAELESMRTQVDAYAAALKSSQAQVDAYAAELEALEATVEAVARRTDAFGPVVERLDPLPVGDELRLRDERGNETLGFRGAVGVPAKAAYAAFEDVFRGSEDSIKERQRVYVDIVAGHEPVLDVGCGRGEFLELLAEAGIQARGIDVDSGMVARARDKGHEVERAEAVEHLEGQPDGSWGAIFCAQLIEHLPYERLMRFLELCRTKLVPGGLLVMETVNPHAIAAFRNFWRDPTHQAPIYPEVAVTLCRIQGFESASVYFPRGTGELERDLPQEGDYAVVASAPR